MSAKKGKRAHLDPLEPKEIQGKKARKVTLGIQDLVGKKDRKVKKVPMEMQHKRVQVRCMIS